MNSRAFISYRHVPRDIAAAEALHTQIERYTVPTGRKQNTSRSRSKWKVFRDEEELRITNDLPQSIHEALDTSEYLIVVCSPDAMHSKWVPLEIAHFLEHHDRDHVLTVVTAGDPEQMLPELQDIIAEKRGCPLELSESCQSRFFWISGQTMTAIGSSC